MFSSISWFNVLVLLIIGLIVIGPERLPGMIKDMRAVALAFRNLVNDARRQLDDDFGPELKEFQKPLSQLNEYRRMGPRGLVTKALFDGDDSFFNDLEDTSRQLRDSVNSVTNPNHTSAQRPASQAPTAAAQTGTTSQFGAGAQPQSQHGTAQHGTRQHGTGQQSTAQQGPAAGNAPRAGAAGGAAGAGGGTQPKSTGNNNGHSGSVWDDVL